MGDNFNIRDFRNAGVSEEDVAAEKSNRTFYMCVIAIPVIAAVAGLGYKPLMDLRGNNVQAAHQAQLDMEARRRAENPLYALMNGPKNEDGLIDANVAINFGGNNGPSPEAKARNEYAKRALNAHEFLNRVDAKAHGFSPLEMETLKYTRTVWALTTCKHSDLRAFYKRSNESKYEKLKTKSDEARNAEREERMAKVDQLELPKVENTAQAMAFVATGGVARHQEAAMNTFAGLASMTSDMEKSAVRTRRQRFNKTGCMNVRTIVQSGTMNVKTNTRLR